jgi:hypothetical protein
MERITVMPERPDMSVPVPRSEHRDALDAAFEKFRQGVRADFHEMFANLMVWMQEYIASLTAPADDKSKDPPPRVTRLEETVFSPAPRRNRPKKRRAS